MKRKTGGILLSCVMGAALLSGCASTIAPVSESASHPTAQSAVDSADGASSEGSNAPADQPVSPAFTPAPATVPPRPEQTQSDPVVYAEGKIAADGDALFEVPGGMDADRFRSFALCLTVAIQSPIDSIENADDKTAFRLSRCMLECFYRTHPDICDQVVYREAPDGCVRNYTVIPLSDFLDFTATHLGLDTLDFFKNAIPAEDEVVRFDEENGQILFVPSLESIASDFDIGHVEREGDLLRLYASSESKGECVYVFDISNSMDQYLLVRVD